MYKENPTIFKIKFNCMVSDFKLYNYIHKKWNGNKRMIKSTYQMIGMFDYILEKQLRFKKRNKELFKSEYIDPYIFTYQKVSEKVNLSVEQIKRLIAKRNGYKQKVFKA